MISTVVIFAVALLLGVFSFQRPVYGLVLGLNAYLVRHAAGLLSPTLAAEAADNTLAILLPLSVIVAVGLYVVRAPGRTRIVVTQVDVALALLTVTLLLGATYAPDVLRGVSVGVRFVGLALSYYILLRLLAHNMGAQRVLGQFASATFFIALSGAIISLIAPQLSGGARLTIGEAHPIPFSILLGQGILCAMYLILVQSRRVLVFPALLVLLVQFGETVTRGTTIALLGAVLLCCFPVAIRLLRSRWRLSVVFMIIPAVLAAAWLVSIFAAESVDRLVASTAIVFSENKGASAEGRLAAYRIAWNELGNPRVAVVGLGTGGFASVGNLEYVHNLVLEAFVENGIPGVLATIALLIGGLCIALVASLQPSDSNEHWQAVLALGLYTFLVIESQFSMTMWMHKGLFSTLALCVIVFLARNHRTAIQ